MFKNFLIFLFVSSLVFFSGFSFAAPAKVSAVIPVKFNSRGLHAPVPYSQQMMQRGWTRVPTMNLPFTFSGGSKFNPTRVSKKSLARSIGGMAARAKGIPPQIKVAMILYGAYEANCAIGNYPTLCMDTPLDEENIPEDFPFSTASKIQGTVCNTNVKGVYTEFELRGQKNGWDCTIEANKNYAEADLLHAFRNADCKPVVKSTMETGIMYQERRLVQTESGLVCGDYGSQKAWSVNAAVKEWKEILVCPPEPTGVAGTDAENAKRTLKVVHVNSNGSTESRCYNPSQPNPITPAWIEDQINGNPEPVSGLDITDFVDPTTGAPDPNLFENPTVDDVSPAFRDAAEAAARGTLQSDNPNAEGYVPPDLYQSFVVNLNNWYEGNSFTDVFTNKPVEPEVPQPEPTPTDWTDFPGITQKQYEASNNAWGQSATNGAADIESELSKVETEFTKLTDEINNIPDSLPYPDINLADLVLFPSGGCTGFTVDVTLAGEPKTISVDKHCPPYEAWGRPFVEWVLSILTILVIFHIFRRTLENS